MQDFFIRLINFSVKNVQVTFLLPKLCKLLTCESPWSSIKVLLRSLAPTSLSPVRRFFIQAKILRYVNIWILLQIIAFTNGRYIVVAGKGEDRTFLGLRVDCLKTAKDVMF